MKINLLVIFLFTSLLLNAQIKKGALFIGGDVSVYGSKYKGTDPANQVTSQNNGFNFSPSLGWVVKDNVIVGGRLMASFDNSKNQPLTYSAKANRIGAGIFMRKYLPLGKSFYLFGDGGLNAQSNYSKQVQSPPMQQSVYTIQKGLAITVTVFPGLSYQVKKSLFIEAALNNLISLGYVRNNTEQSNQNGNIFKGVNNSYNLSSSLGNGVPLQLGMRWMFAKR